MQHSAMSSPMSDHDPTSKLTRLEPYETPLRLIPYPGQAWLPLCRSGDVRERSCRSERLAQWRLVLFRDAEGMVRALEDRCPHRGVPLSLGTCERGRLVCAYHGMQADGDGRFGNLRIRTVPVQEHAGIVWAYTGDQRLAQESALPDLGRYGKQGSVDLAVDLDMKTHFSLALDNGVDLTHDHLHRQNLYFFKILSLGNVVEGDGYVEVSYRAKLRNEYNQLREGMIRTRFAGPLAMLDFDGQPIIYSLLTPRDANGRWLTQWWFASFKATRWQRPQFWVAMPFLRRIMLNAFKQDKLVLEAEAKAVFDDNFAQTERNPMVREVGALWGRQLLAESRRRLALLPVQSLPARDVLSQVARRELAVIEEGRTWPLTEAELAQRLNGQSCVRMHRDWAHALLAS